MGRSEVRIYYKTLKAGMAAFGLKNLRDQAFVERWAAEYADRRIPEWTLSQLVNLGLIAIWTVPSGSYLAIGERYDTAISDPVDPYLLAATIYANRIEPRWRSGGGPTFPFPGQELHTRDGRYPSQPIDRIVSAAIEGATVDWLAPKEDRVHFVPSQLGEVFRLFQKNSAYDGVYSSVYARVNAAVNTMGEGGRLLEKDSIESHDAMAGLKLTELLKRSDPTNIAPTSNSLSVGAQKLFEDEIR